MSEEAAENFFYAFPESGDFYHAILQEFDDIISGHSGNYQITVIPLSGLRLPPMIMRNPEKKYAPCFDERIFTEKLIGKPSLGPSPPRFIY